MFIRNAWYVAATPDEIDPLGAGRPLARQVCGERMVLFRGPSGAVSALEDFCPHRGAPLSLGRVCDGELVCGYHGLRMGCDGRTVAMPGQRVRGFPAIRAWPVAEYAGFVWVWPGDPALASHEQLPALPWADGTGVKPGWAYGGGHYEIACEWRLMIDNLMDLTHETYVHADSIGQPEIDETPSQTRMVGDEVITSRTMNAIQAPPFWQQAVADQFADELSGPSLRGCGFGQRDFAASMAGEQGK
jgi:vanillate O-demethylase monooxygenase subunit